MDGGVTWDSGIGGSRTVIFMVTGEAKAQALRSVLKERKRDLPASMVHPAEGKLVFLIDQAAASLLDDRIESKESGR